jgi:glucose-like phosphotransferase system IIB component
VPILVGIALAPIYFFFFRWAVLKFDLATPGRGGNTKLFTKADFKASQETKKNMNSKKAQEVIQAYGGNSNITEIGACFTKLRVSVVDVNKVDKQKLKDLGAHGVIQPSPYAVYAVFGTEADVLKNMMKDLIGQSKNEKA